MMNRRGWVLTCIAALPLCASQSAQAAPLTCIANASVPPVVRCGGRAELVADVVLVCSGGIPTAAGAEVPKVNFTLYLNTAVTSKILAGNWSEALLLVDEPAHTRQLACGTENGSCSITGTGTGTEVYSGVAGRPNVFQGQASGNALSWVGVPLDPPGDSTVRVLRFTNLRANASALACAGPTPPSVQALLGVSGPMSVPISNPTQIVAFGQPALSFSVTPVTPGPFTQCVGENTSLLKCR